MLLLGFRGGTRVGVVAACDFPAVPRTWSRQCGWYMTGVVKGMDGSDGGLSERILQQKNRVRTQADDGQSVDKQ